MNERIFDLAQKTLGLTDGNQPNDPEHHQPCPIPGCSSSDNGFRFYPTQGTFHCRKCGFSGNLRSLVAKVLGITREEARSIIGNADGAVHTKTALPKAGAKQKRFVDGTMKTVEYIYTNEDGKDQHKVVRYEGVEASTGQPGKTFSQWKIQDDLWVKGAPALTFPYRLLEVLLAITLFIVEGKKTANGLNRVLWASGSETTVATTSPMGAQNGHFWMEYLQRYSSIADKKIFILPDNDPAGMAYARTVATAILVTNPKADVRIVELPDLPVGGDFVDWFAELEKNGKDKSNVIELLKTRCKSAPRVTPEDIATWKQSEPAGSASERNDTAIELMKKWKPFPLETLPRKLRLYVKQGAQSIGIDPAYIAATVLSIVSGIIGRTFVIEIKQGYQEYAMLWVVVVADSGLGKSPALKHPRQPLDRLEREARKEYKKEYAKYKAQPKDCPVKQFNPYIFPGNFTIFLFFPANFPAVFVFEIFNT